MDSIAIKNAKQFDAHAEDWDAAMGGNAGHRYLEKPAMERELPDCLAGKAVLCIGVGSGDELKEILQRGPSRVVGIDISNELLKIAQSRFPGVAFEKMEMTDLRFPDASFDFVYSSLTFHYARDWDVLLSGVYGVMKSGGELLFSTHHPGYWSGKPATGKTYVNPRGVTLTEHTATLPGEVEIIYYNHPDVGAIREAVEHASFQIQKCFEPPVVDVAESDSLSAAEREAYLKLKRTNVETPLFLVVNAKIK